MINTQYQTQYHTPASYAGSYSHQFGSRGNRGGDHVKLFTTREPVRTVRMQHCGVQCEEEGHCGLTETSWKFGDYHIVKSVTTYSLCPQVTVFKTVLKHFCDSLNSRSFPELTRSLQFFSLHKYKHFCFSETAGKV